MGGCCRRRLLSATLLESSEDSGEGAERVIVWYKNLLVFFHCYAGLKLMFLSECCFFGIQQLHFENLSLHNGTAANVLAFCCVMLMFLLQQHLSKVHLFYT